MSCCNVRKSNDLLTMLLADQIYNKGLVRPSVRLPQSLEGNEFLNSLNHFNLTLCLVGYHCSFILFCYILF